MLAHSRHLQHGREQSSSLWNKNKGRKKKLGFKCNHTADSLDRGWLSHQGREIINKLVSEMLLLEGLEEV